MGSAFMMLYDALWAGPTWQQ